MSNRRRCKCHPAAYYGGCIECWKCRHWSFDPLADACERRACGYVVTRGVKVTEVQTTIDWTALP